MSDQKDPKLNSGSDELVDVKALIGDADGSAYSLDDIMAEYGVPPHPKAPAEPATPPPQPPPEEDRSFDTISWDPRLLRPKPRPGKVVAFPGTQRPAPPPAERERPAPPPPDPEPEEDEEPEEEVPEVQEEEPEGPEEQDLGQVVPFPQEEKGLTGLLKKLNRRADEYADRMFEEDEKIDKAEVRRLERLIPGTDEEQPPEPEPPRWTRPPRRREPPPPDIPPYKLAQRYGKGLKLMRTRIFLLFLLTLLALVQVLVPLTGLAWTAPLDTPALQHGLAAGLLGTGVLLSMDVLLTGLVRALRLRVGMDTLALLACVFTLADGVRQAMSPQPADRLPYSVVCLTGLFFLLRGDYYKRSALRLSCRTAAIASAPYRVSLDEGKWNGRDTYAKWSGTAEGFGSQIQTDDGVQRIFRVFCPLLLLGDVSFALLSSVGRDRPEELLWCLSALFTATAAFGSALAYGRAFHKLARRLAQSGAALAGWPGMSGSRRADRVLITDLDLFPPGYVDLNGYKVMADFPTERVVAYTATLIRAWGSGLSKLFHDQLRSMGGLLRRADALLPHEGGGLSGNIRGDSVLVGSAAFMKLMEVKLPQGLNVKNAVFCAINGELAGIFALSYTLPDTVFPALEELLLERVSPVLATRDFNLIPAMLQQRFKLATDRMDFPGVERRRELSDPEQEHSDVLTALLCREGLLPFAEAVTASKRLRRCARLGAALCCAGSALGLFLAAYLTSVVSYTALSPLHLLFYMLSWLAPVWLLTDWVHRF